MKDFEEIYKKNLKKHGTDSGKEFAKGGYIYKDNGKYKVATSPNFHFEDYGDYECDLYMLIPEMPDNDKPKKEE